MCSELDSVSKLGPTQRVSYFLLHRALDAKKEGVFTLEPRLARFHLANYLALLHRMEEN